MSTKQLSIIVLAILVGTTLGASIIAFGPDYLEYRAQKERDEQFACRWYRMDYKRSRERVESGDDTYGNARDNLRELEEDRLLDGCTHARRYVD